MKSTNYKLGAIKRKFGVKAEDKLEPGDLITRMNSQKSSKVLKTEKVSLTKLSIMGLV